MVSETEKILKKLRVDAGESIVVMAGRLGISPSYLSAVEHGKRAIPKGMLARLQRLYRVSASDIDALIEEEAVSSLKVQIELNPEVSRALNRLALAETPAGEKASWDKKREKLREKRAEILGRLACKAVKKGK